MVHFEIFRPAALDARRTLVPRRSVPEKSKPDKSCFAKQSPTRLTSRKSVAGSKFAASTNVRKLLLVSASISAKVCHIGSFGAKSRLTEECCFFGELSCVSSPSHSLRLRHRCGHLHLGHRFASACELGESLLTAELPFRLPNARSVIPLCFLSLFRGAIPRTRAFMARIRRGIRVPFRAEWAAPMHPAPRHQGVQTWRAVLRIFRPYPRLPARQSHTLEDPRFRRSIFL